MKIILFFLFTTQLFAIAAQQQSVLSDSTIVETRSFKTEHLESFRADPDFDYDRQSFSSISIFDIILAWLWNNFFKYLLQPGTATFWEILIYIFAFSTIVYLVRQFMKNKLSGLFYKAENNQGKIASINENNIHERDLNKLLEQEIENGRFRNAVRLMYLISLKTLSKNNLIHWKIGKTNQEYCSEINSDSQKALFSNLTKLYEYVWYGDFEISKISFELISGHFRELRNSCEQAR